MRAELPTVHAVAPTSHIGPILAPAQTMDNSRDRRPLYTVPRHVDSARRKCYNVAERGAISCVGTVPTVVATPAGAPTLKVRFRCPTNGGRRTVASFCYNIYSMKPIAIEVPDEVERRRKSADIN